MIAERDHSHKHYIMSEVLDFLLKNEILLISVSQQILNIMCLFPPVWILVYYESIHLKMCWAVHLFTSCVMWQDVSFHVNNMYTNSFEVG